MVSIIGAFVRPETGGLQSDHLRIRLLGGFEMERNGQVLPLPATPKSRSLLAYMILHRGRLIHRETVCAALWPDESEPVARKALRTALWRIRASLGDAENDTDGYVYSDAYQVGFRGALPVWVDVWEFEDMVDELDAKGEGFLQAADCEALGRAAMLYRGACAAGVYDDWLIVEQSRLQLAHVALLERIAGFHAGQQRWMQAIGWAERALAADPLREHVHRIIMCCHMSMGDRPSALRQYSRCEAALKTELGIEPMAETRSLMAGILGNGAAHSNGRSSSQPKNAGAIASEIDSVADAAVSSLRQAVRRIDKSRVKGATGRSVKAR